jgi:hypothetical protein
MRVMAASTVARTFAGTSWAWLSGLWEKKAAIVQLARSVNPERLALIDIINDLCSPNRHGRKFKSGS